MTSRKTISENIKKIQGFDACYDKLMNLNFEKNEVI